MTTSGMTAQQIKLEQASEQLEFFQKYCSIPKDYRFGNVTEVKVDKVCAYWFRYQKKEYAEYGGEHFSFIVTKEKPFRILGFTCMDAQYTGGRQLSKQETEEAARTFIQKTDPVLNQSLSNIWIEQHDEEINVEGQKTTVSGMKYKCYNAAEKTYAWVIIGNNGSIITFERDILWSNGMHRRITEKWLHDAWLIETSKVSQDNDNEALKQMIQTCFLNGALNKLNVDKMAEGFHPDFAILIPDGNKLNRLPLSVWMDVIEKYKTSPEKMKSGIRDVEYTYEIVDVTGNTAIAKIQLYRKNQLITTDYISFLKFTDGWKAISKISNEHIPNPFNI